MEQQKIQLIGAALGIGAADQGCVDGPAVLQAYMQTESTLQKDFQWKTILKSEANLSSLAALPAIADFSEHLAYLTAECVQSSQPFITIGGDHACAIGTWSGVSENLAAQGKRLGVIWIDAHMDAHTPETSHTGNVHGMPVAVLLGHGDPRLTGIQGSTTKVAPQALCQIGIRCYEPEEAALLENDAVKVFYDHDVEKQGIEALMAQALAHIQPHCDVIGISIDLDGLDPKDAPGVGTPVERGIPLDGFLTALKQFEEKGVRFIGAEITEFNPGLDVDDRTLKTVGELLLGLKGLMG